AVEGVFVLIGLMPNTEWLKDSVDLNNRGEIKIDATGQTSLAGVFAAGDCTNQIYKQIIISMGSGATAALGAFDYLMRNY
ncbi:FAD-dependent oxidoreductase, partial [Granulicatella balaenopterae]